MAGRNGSPNGCLIVAGALFAPSIAGFVIGVPAFILAAPAVAPYLYFRDPAQFEPHRLQWLAAVAAAPLLALALVFLTSPANGRLRGQRRVSAHRSPGGRRQTQRRTRRQSGRQTRRHPPPQTRRRARWPSILLAYLVRAAVLLTATTVSALVMLLRGNDGRGPDAMREILMVFGSAAVAAVVVLVAVRLWDRHPYVGPVTVETVREAATQAQETLRRVRADNERLSRLVRETEAKLAAAGAGATGPSADFASLCELHFESVGCADGAYGHYRSAQTSLHVMAQILGGVKAATRQPLRIAGRPFTSKARQDKAELIAAASNLAGTHGQLDVQVRRGLDLVKRLNANTGELKYSIRDNCGERGKSWYEALEQRIEAARASERREPRMAR